MTKRAWGLAALMLGLSLGQAQAQVQDPDRPFDPREYQSRLHGEKTQILVLGSPHLSNAAEGFDPAVLEPVLERLAAYAPDVIVIENLSGESVHALRAWRALYPGAADMFGRHLLVAAALGQSGTGLEIPEAEAEARRLLREDWPQAPTPAQRRRLAAVLASAGDLYSALIQWWRLDASERKPGDGLGRGLADYLDRVGSGRNESHLIGARLAARLGHDRVHASDDQAYGDVVQPRVQLLMDFIEQPELQAVFNAPAFRDPASSAQRMTTAQATLDIYRMVNSPRIGRLDADTQWLTMMDRPSPENIGRSQVAAWEARNLRQAGNIREVTAHHPGARVLVIVGYSHKPWFDAYLSMMSDVQMVDAETVLR